MLAYGQIRDIYRLTQNELSRALGVSRTTVSMWESGASTPPPAVQAAYRKLQEPIRKGDLVGVERLRGAVLSTADRAAKEARRLNRASPAEGLTEILKIAAGAVAIGLLLAALFSAD